MAMNVTTLVLVTVARVHQKKNVYGVKTLFITDHIVSIDVQSDAMTDDVIKVTGHVLRGAKLVFLE
jgi:hypothetical protein